MFSETEYRLDPAKGGVDFSQKNFIYYFCSLILAIVGEFSSTNSPDMRYPDLIGEQGVFRVKCAFLDSLS